MHDVIYGIMLAYGLFIWIYCLPVENFIVVSCRPHDLSIDKNDPFGIVDMCNWFCRFHFCSKKDKFVMKRENIYLQCTQFQNGLSS